MDVDRIVARVGLHKMLKTGSMVSTAHVTTATNEDFGSFDIKELEEVKARIAAIEQNIELAKFNRQYDVVRRYNSKLRRLRTKVLAIMGIAGQAPNPNREDMMFYRIFRGDTC